MITELFIKSEVSPSSNMRLTGWVIHLLNGSILLPLIFAFVFSSLISIKYWLKGIYFGIALWLFVQVVFMPLMGNVFFASNKADLLLRDINSLVTHLVYGISLSLLYNKISAKVSGSPPIVDPQTFGKK